MEKRLSKENEIIGERFKLARYINSGGQGEVWEAKDTIEGNAKVAVKLFPEGPLSRALDEVKALSNLKHERIVKFIDTNITSDQGTDTDTLRYLAMEFAEYGNLRQHNYFRGDIDLSSELFCNICDGVSAMHKAGYFHRDLKPSNILVGANQRDLKVGDFGLCLPPDDADRDKTPGRENVGPIYFTAPEQTSNPPNVTAKSDIYSLGRILHWMITDKYEYRPGDSYEPVSTILGLSQQLEIDRLIERMVAFEPKNRPGTIEEIISKLRPEGLAAEGAKVIKVTADQALLRNFIVASSGSAHLKDLVEHMAIIYGVEKNNSILSSPFVRMQKYSWKDISIKTLNDLNQMIDANIIYQSGNTFELPEEFD